MKGAKLKDLDGEGQECQEAHRNQVLCQNEVCQVLGQIARAFTYRDKVHFIKLYKVYVRCHLDYAVQSWSPYLQQDINVLEAV